MLTLGRRTVSRLNGVLRNVSTTFTDTQSVTAQNSTTPTEGSDDTPDYRASFHHARIGNFFQEKPVLHNPYLGDSILGSFLRRNIPDEHFSVINDDLTRFGARVRDEIDARGLECERNSPTLTQYNAWGKRIDQINTCDAWKSMKTISAEEGLIAIGYERNYGEASRLYQMAKLYLFGASSGLYSCPLAMTDGASKVLESVFPNVSTDDGIFGNAFRRLTSRNPDHFWTSGQWMTEKRGGSDVGNATDTVAYEQPDGSYKLYGYKWFTSATDADMVLTLARIVNENGEVVQGSRGLSMFFMETKGEHGKRLHSGLNGLQVQRLKDKLGTRQLPTAEMLLDGSIAYQVGEKSRGVRSISDMLLITRIYNSVMGISGINRLLQLAVDYSHRRSAFGLKLCDNTLHVQTLARMDVEVRAAVILTFEITRLLGLQETNSASEEDIGLLRLLTPICKLYTAKQSLEVSTEGLECFGGAGFLEDTGLPRILRDSQVLSIWEGTTNVLSMDVLRAIEKSRGEVLVHLFTRIGKILKKVKESGKSELAESVERVESAANDLATFMNEVPQRSREEITNAARDLSYSIARIYMAVLLLEHAIWHGSDWTDVHAAIRWCAKDPCPVVQNSRSGCFTSESSSMDKDLVFRSYQGDVSTD